MYRSFEQYNELSYSVKEGEFIEHMSNYNIFQMDYAPRCQSLAIKQSTYLDITVDF
jgi:hypothetical protein